MCMEIHKILGMLYKIAVEIHVSFSCYTRTIIIINEEDVVALEVFLSGRTSPCGVMATCTCG